MSCGAEVSDKKYVFFFIISCLQKSLTNARDRNHDNGDGCHHNIRSDLPVLKPAACGGSAVFFSNCRQNFLVPVVFFVPLSASAFCSSV